MADTLSYYRENAARFFAATVDVDMTELYAPFLARIPAGGLLLDAGCGSGRDSRAFLARGYRVRAFDACPELAALAATHLGSAVEVRRFEDVDEENCYDGIWACASLLHVPVGELDGVLLRLWRALKPGGTFYVSFQAGGGERGADGRHFTDADEKALRGWLDSLPERCELESWTSRDRRPERSTLWTNAVARKAPMRAAWLVTGGENPFLPHLCEAIRGASEIDFAVAFVLSRGLDLLLPDLRAALQGEPPARVRILTSDYLGVTEPEALSKLALLRDAGAQVRVFACGEKQSFHLKAYLFARLDERGGMAGTAFVGSSNLSLTALRGGLEWNYRIEYPGEAGYLETRNRFEELFADGRTVELSEEWIAWYAGRRKAQGRVVVAGCEEADPPPEPTMVQREALAALEAKRVEGYGRGLVVLATGLGKTWLAAFDTVRMKARRVLFVAHREEILDQARSTFLRIRPEARMGRYMGTKRDDGAEVLCASIQTLGRAAHLRQFAPDHFDYIVVDEFHHASAPTYRRLLGHFTPQFLLGLTATPQRSDQADILALCDGNLVYTCDLVRGVEEQLLAPFTYYGIYDAEVDYREIPWRNGQFDLEALEARVATRARAEHAMREWRKNAQTRTLAFCVSIRHAEFMAEYFAGAGVAAAAVHGRSGMSRGAALEGLRQGSLQVIFSVDLFNEGVDLPEIDTVLMLRPTESKILFLQQLGRGLRRAEGKERLVVMDFIGNHRSFLHKPQALFGWGTTYRELLAFVWGRGEAKLPAGCFVNFDLGVIPFLQSLEARGGEREYAELRELLGRRPSVLEYTGAGGDLTGGKSWVGMVEKAGDLPAGLGEEAREFLRELETTPMTRSFKMILLEAFQELDGWEAGPTLGELGRRSWEVLQRRRELLGDVPEEYRDAYVGKEWLAYWRKNPVNAWIGGNRGGGRVFFGVEGGRMVPRIQGGGVEFADVVQELVDYRLAGYVARPTAERVELPYFPSLAIACGHFRDGLAAGEIEGAGGRVRVETGGKLDGKRHFVARASGNSMNGGKHPVRDGDYLLLERMGPERAGSISGYTLVVERLNEAGDSEYLLRAVIKRGAGDYVLRAWNRAYGDMEAGEDLKTWARFVRVLAAAEVETDG